MIHHIKRATRHLIFWSLIATAIGLTCLRLVLSGVEHYKADLAAHIGAAVGTPVTIGHLGAKMRGFNPQLVLKDIALDSKVQRGIDKPTIEFNEIRLGIHLLELLVSRDVLSSSWVTLVGAKLTVKRQQDGSIVIVGLKAGEGQPQWLLQGGKYELLHSEITWQDETSQSRPLLFKGIDLAIRNDGERHRLNMLMKLPEKIGDALRVSMDFNGNIFEPATLQGRLYIDGTAVNVPELAALEPALLGDSIKINTGLGDFKIWADWRQAQVAAVDVDAKIEQLALLRQGKPEFLIKRLKTDLHWGMDELSKQWRLDVYDFSLATQADAKGEVKSWPGAVFSVLGQRSDDKVWHKAAAFIERLDLQEASELAQFFAVLPEPQAKLLSQAQLKGVVEDFSLFADLDAKALALNGGFTGIGIASLQSVPGIDNLTGRIKGSEKQGSITLATNDAWLIAPELFRQALPVKRLQGALNWLQTADHGWSVSSPSLALDSLSFQSETRFRIDIPEAAKPVFMDLQTSFVGEDAREVKQYLPVGIMDEEVVAWLDRAFVGGRMADGGLLVYGNLEDFPFTEAPGVFEAVFTGEQFELSYDPEWPNITGMNAEVMFSQGGLKVDVLQGQSGIAKEGADVTIKQAEVTIPSLNKSKQLLIKGEAEAGIDRVLAYMQHTPLRSPVDSLLEAITPQGNTQVALDLKLPLVDGAPTKVDGAAQLKDARLTVKSLDLAVGKINGELKFNEQGVYSDTIKATALGHPITVDIQSSDSATTVNVDGKVGISDLQAQFDLPWWSIADGETDYRLRLALPYGEAAPVLLAESQLSGVALDLPESLAKTREQQTPLSVEFSLNDSPLLPVRLNYGNKLKAAIQLDTKQKTVYSGHLLIGDGEVAQPQEAGLKLEMNRDRLPLHDWLGLAVAQGASNGIRELSIHSNHAQWKKTELGNFDLNLKPKGGFWAGAINSAFAQGNIQIPSGLQNTDRIKLDMTLLDLTALKQLGGKDDAPLQALSPDSMPLLTLTSQQTLWQSIDLGRLTLATERIPGGMGFNNVQLAGENQQLVFSGDWKTGGGQAITHSLGHLEVPRAGKLLEQLGITKDITETQAAVDFNVSWNAAPYQFSLADVKGQLDIKLKNGRILSIEPGFGRVLGMLALAQWIKRAQLDFSDIYAEGLTFNTIKGHFDLAGGIAASHDLVVDAVPAKIAINGKTDLVNRTVDHIVDVTPKSADAVPIAGTIMGKLAALVGRSLTGKDQEGFFFGSQYLVKGAWGNAEIIPMHKNDGLLQKTWNGITDFPWLKPQEENKER